MASRITREKIRKLAESQQVEFKRSLGRQKEGLKSLTAMVNTDQRKGTVVFGVGPDGEIVGVEPGNLDSAQITLADLARQAIDPSLAVGIELLDCEGTPLVSIFAERSRDVPLHEYDGRAFLREGSSNRRLSFEQRQRLIRSRSRDSHTGPWECDTCKTFTAGLFQTTLTEKGPVRSFECECGGEYWPAG